MELDFINNDYESYKALIEMIVASANGGTIEVEIPNMIRVSYTPKESSRTASDEERQRFADNAKASPSIAEMMSAFAGQTEEFYPNGREKGND